MIHLGMMIRNDYEYERINNHSSYLDEEFLETKTDFRGSHLLLRLAITHDDILNNNQYATTATL